MQPKLKEKLSTNVPVVVILKKRAGTYPNQFAPGEMNYMYIFDMGGQEHVHFANEREEGALGLFREGEEVQVIRREMVKGDKRIYFLEWTPISGIEARAAAKPQLRTNTGEDTQKKRAAEMDYERRMKDICICLQGLTQSFIIAGDPKPLECARLMRKELLKAAQEEIEAEKVSQIFHG